MAWTISPDDWLHNSTKLIAKQVQKAVFPGTIILLHDGASSSGDLPESRQSTVLALELMIDYLSDAGYRFVTVTELIELHGGI